MRRRLLALAPLALLPACSGYDVTINWTIDGEDPATACAAFDAPEIHVTSLSRDGYDSRAGAAQDPVDVHFGCDQASGVIQTGRFADVVVALSDGGEEGAENFVGLAPSLFVEPGAPSSGTQLEAEAATADIRITQSKLAATLTVVGESCGAAGASSFTVTLAKNIGPLDTAIVEENVSVPCTDGNAVYVPATRLEVGATYLVRVTADVGGTTFGTDEFGEGVVPAGAHTVATIDLAAR